MNKYTAELYYVWFPDSKRWYSTNVKAEIQAYRRRGYKVTRVPERETLTHPKH